MSQKEPAYYGYELKKVSYDEYIKKRTDTPQWRKVLARFILAFFAFLSGLIKFSCVLFEPEVFAFLLFTAVAVFFCHNLI
jgi:hypothetical protein